MQDQLTYKYGDIVLYKKQPALVMAVNANGRGVILKLSGKMWVTTLITNLKPYTGDGNAVSLGLEDPCR